MTLTQLANQEGWSNDKVTTKTQQMGEPMVDPGYSEMKDDTSNDKVIVETQQMGEPMVDPGHSEVKNGTESSCDSFIPKEPELTREPEVRIDPKVALPHSKPRWETVRRVRKKVDRPVLKLTMDRQDQFAGVEEDEKLRWREKLGKEI